MASSFHPTTIDFASKLGCQIFFVEHTKTGKNQPNDNKKYQMDVK
jgi:hypothetical protein